MTKKVSKKAMRRPNVTVVNPPPELADLESPPPPEPETPDETEKEKRPSPTLHNPNTLDALAGAVTAVYVKRASAGRLALGCGGYALEDFIADLRAELEGR